jgi:hypothetical protein
MLRLVRLTEVSCLLLVTLVQLAAAQSPFLRPEPPPNLRADEIIENSAGFRITGSIVNTDGAIVPGLLIICRRDGAGGEAILVVQDRDAKTDERMRVNASVCADWLRILRQRKDAQSR